MLTAAKATLKKEHWLVFQPSKAKYVFPYHFPSDISEFQSRRQDYFIFQLFHV